MTDNSDVTIEQYKSLRAEIDSLIDETRKIEIQVLGAIGAFYAWLVTHPGVKDTVWHLATCLALFGALRALGLFMRMGDISRYMKEIEKQWKVTDGNPHKGWETHFGEAGNNHFPLSWVTFGFWIVLVLGTMAAPPFLKPDGNGAEKVMKVEVVKPIPATVDGVPKGQ